MKRSSTSRVFAVLLAVSTLMAAASPSRALSAPPQWKLDWTHDAVFYEIFVRSFADSNGDGIGDLQGLIAKLDYLNDGDPKTTSDLGVDAIWLMPIFESPSYHGYDVSDYESVRAEYGTLDDFDRLIHEAHRRGIRVILDLPLNQTSWFHPWFVASALAHVAQPPIPRDQTARDWYLWRTEDPGWLRPWDAASVWHRCEACDAYYYALFDPQLPEPNYRHPAMRAKAKQIIRFWLDRGVDGFRLDAARYLIEEGDGPGQNDTALTHAFWKEISAYVRSIRPEALLVGEVWTDTPGIATYFGDTTQVMGGDEIPMTFDFPLSYAIMGALGAEHAASLAAALREIQSTYSKSVLDATFLSNHDTLRTARQLRDDPARLRQAAALLFTLPGTPNVYYGEELGVGQPEGKIDESKRLPMPWDASPAGGFTTGKPWAPFSDGHERANVATEQMDAGSLLARYRALIALRHASEALRRGHLELLSAKEGVLAFLRETASETILVVHNLGARPASPEALPLRGTPRPLFADPGVTAPIPTHAGWTLDLPAHTSGVWRLAPAPRPLRRAR